MRPAQENELGLNKTGAAMSPIDTAEMAEGSLELTSPSPGDQSAIGQNRLLYMREADPIGSVPVPSTLKGAMSSVQEKLKMDNHLFMNKLGERLAFERSGTRLYEALLVKYQGSEDQDRLPPFETLKHFYQEELKHFQMLWNAMKELGGDPTSVTPAADVSAVASMGWVQVLTDPRTSFAQSLDVILMAELADTDGWDLLVQLADSMGLNDMADQFRDALVEEETHLLHVRKWVHALSLGSQDFELT